MKSVITAKFQTTIREGLQLSIHDALDWEIENGKVIIRPIHSRFLNHKNSIRVGKGSIEENLEASKVQRFGTGP